MSSEGAINNPPPLSDLLFADGTPRKAFLTAIVVGTILTGINHGDVILDGGLPPLIKVGLTYCVPYCVTTWGAATGKRAQWKRDHPRGQGLVQAEGTRQ